jgi:cation transport ATPase
VAPPRPSVPPPDGGPARLLASHDARIALLAIVGIGVHLWLRYGTRGANVWVNVPLFVALIAVGVPVVAGLIWRGLHGQFGADHLAGISIVAFALLGEYLAGAIVVLMLSGGNTLERFAVAEATSVLRALAKRVPILAHRRRGVLVEDVPVGDIQVGDEVSVLPHEICPVDGEVVLGHGTMDESYLTGNHLRFQRGRAP